MGSLWLSPSFVSSKYNYNLSVPFLASALVVDESSGWELQTGSTSGTGKTLRYGDNKLIVQPTNTTGSPQPYSIDVTRSEEPQARLLLPAHCAIKDLPTQRAALRAAMYAVLRAALRAQVIRLRLLWPNVLQASGGANYRQQQRAAVSAGGWAGPPVRGGHQCAAGC